MQERVPRQPLVDHQFALRMLLHISMCFEMFAACFNLFQHDSPVIAKTASFTNMTGSDVLGSHYQFVVLLVTLAVFHWLTPFVA